MRHVEVGRLRGPHRRLRVADEVQVVDAEALLVILVERIRIWRPARLRASQGLTDVRRVIVEDPRKERRVEPLGRPGRVVALRVNRAVTVARVHHSGDATAVGRVYHVLGQAVAARDHVPAAGVAGNGHMDTGLVAIGQGIGIGGTKELHRTAAHIDAALVAVAVPVADTDTGVHRIHHRLVRKRAGALIQPLVRPAGGRHPGDRLLHRPLFVAVPENAGRQNQLLDEPGRRVLLVLHGLGHELLGHGHVVDRCPAHVDV